MRFLGWSGSGFGHRGSWICGLFRCLGSLGRLGRLGQSFQGQDIGIDLLLNGQDLFLKRLVLFNLKLVGGESLLAFGLNLIYISLSLCNQFHIHLIFRLQIRQLLLGLFPKVVELLEVGFGFCEVVVRVGVVGQILLELFKLLLLCLDLASQLSGFLGIAWGRLQRSNRGSRSRSFFCRIRRRIRWRRGRLRRWSGRRRCD